ncbi:MAG: GAF domain-containing protein [Nitrospinaceae bacterium]|nr:MAG: GAF domain-containing protein [Nitrospinaceae bacterium]
MMAPSSLETVNYSADPSLNSVLRGVVKDVKDHAERLMSQIRELSSIGRSLSGVYDLDDLLEKIVDNARAFTHADAGTLYIKEDDRLRFSIFQNDSLGIRLGGKTGGAIPYPPLALDKHNVSAFVAMNGTSVNIPDVYDAALYDFTGPKKFDRTTGYRSKSMLVVLLKNHENDIIGVLQLLNARDTRTGKAVPFSKDCESLTQSLASQAAVAISNVKLITDMENLFEAFVKVMATAIDEKSPATGGHIRRVAHLTLTLAETINNKDSGPFKHVHFNEDQMHELRIASWMHDIGKVTTPVEIIEKSRKLETIFDRIEHVRLRMDYLVQKTRNRALKEQVEAMKSGANAGALQAIEAHAEKQVRQLLEIREFLTECNKPAEGLDDDKIERLKAIAQKTYIDDTGRRRPLITPDELENLSIRKGSITEAERKIMKEHAYMTLKMLSQIPFTKKFRNIPHFAGAHHECLDGTGYPLGLKGDEIPFEGKLMAVTDIAEALTSADRPYKKAMPLAEVHRVLRSLADKGKLDGDLVRLFIEEDVYSAYVRKYEKAQPAASELGPAPGPRKVTG